MQEHIPLLKRTILQVVSNHLRINDPPKTRETLDLLMAEGHSRQESMKMIGAVVSAHISDMVKKQRVYNKESCVKDLNRLPNSPGRIK